MRSFFNKKGNFMLGRIKKKLLVFLGLFLMLFGALAGCSSNSNSVDENAYKLIVGMEAAYPPFNWTETSSTDENVLIKGSEYAAGYDVKVAKYVAQDNGWNLKIIAMDWDSLIPSLQAGTITAIMAGMSSTDERRQSIDFTDAYYDSTLYLVTRKYDSRFNSGSNFDFKNELKGVNLVTQSGTFEDDIAQDWANDFGAIHLSGTDDYPGAFLQVSKSIADAVICEYPVAQSTVNADASLKMVPFDNSLLEQKYIDQTKICAGIKKSAPDGILEKINASLAKLSDETRTEWMNAAVAAQGSESEETTPSMGDQIGQLLGNYGATFGYGLLNTLLLAIIGTVVGLGIGIVCSQVYRLKYSKRDNKFVRSMKWLAKAIVAVYTTVFRGTPMMVQAMILFTCSSVWANMNVGGGWGNFLNGYMLCGMIIICINTGAYMTQNMKSGMNGVDYGQIEAAQSLGVNSHSTLWKITMPQALKNALPSIGNEYIVNIKDSSVLNVIGLTELYRSVSVSTKVNYFTVAGYIIIACIYLLLTVIFSALLQLVENKLNIPDKVNWFGIRCSTIDSIKKFFRQFKKKEALVAVEGETVPSAQQTSQLVDVELLKQAQRKENQDDLN